MSRSLREVVFVDGVRTPFGKAGPKGMYAETRADDLVVACIRELMRRNPGLPPERVDDVAIAATTQIGDQGLTIGRTAALLAGLPRSVPGYAIDRMCAGAMTAVTTAAGGLALGADGGGGGGGALRSARTTWWWPAASSTWGTTRWARASTRTRASSPRSSSTRRRS